MSHIGFADRRDVCPLIAADIAFENGLIEDLVEAFASALIDVFDPPPFPKRDLLNRSRLHELVQLLRGDTGKVEALAEGYIGELERLGIGDRLHSDYHLTAEYINGVVWGDDRAIEAFHYRLDWRLIKKYTELRVHEITPVHFILDARFPAYKGFLQAKEAFRKSVESVSPVVFDASVVTGSQYHRSLLLRFFALNSAWIKVPPRGAVESAPMVDQFPYLELAARKADSSLIGTIEGNSARDNAPSLSCSAPRHIVHNFAGGTLDREQEPALLGELVVKCALIRRLNEHYIQGIPSALYKAILFLLEGEGTIVSVRDIKQRTGVQIARIDPFAVLPGRISCYAPGERFLHGDHVSFCLSDWVEREMRQRGKISKSRILTPLRTIGEILSRERFLDVIDRDMVWNAVGIINSSNSRFVNIRCDKHEERWVRVHTSRRAELIAQQTGYRVDSGLIFDPKRWSDTGHQQGGRRKILDRSVALLGGALELLPEVERMLSRSAS